MLLAAAILFFAADAFAAEAPALRGDFAQGGLVIGKAQPGDTLTLDGKPVPTDAKGDFLLGFGRDAAAQAVLTVRGTDGSVRTVRIAVAPRDWPVQRIDGLPQEKVTPPPAVLAKIAADTKAVEAAREKIRTAADFLTGFALPAEGPVSGVFGSQRILNGEPRAPHSGLDIAAPRGSVAHAAADGVVSMVRPDMYFTGNTLMIDHGLGLQSVYAHLDRIDVKAGQAVKRGQPIGIVGATGRATGPHLHWGLSWLDRRLDPARIGEVLPSAPPPP